MNLNVGSGVHPAPDWINFDSYDQESISVRGSAIALPFVECTMDRVYFGHTLEHLSYGVDVTYALIEAWLVLKIGGELGVVGPAMDLALETQQPLGIIDAIKVHEYPGFPGHGHMWEATSESTLTAVQRVFPDAHLVPVGDVHRGTGWPNTEVSPWQVAILATKEI